MAHHLGGECRRDAAHARNLFRKRAVKRFHDRVEQLCIRISGVESRPDFVIDLGHDVGAQQSLDDHSAISFDDGVDGVGVCCLSVNVLDPGPGSHECTPLPSDMFRRYIGWLVGRITQTCA